MSETRQLDKTRLPCLRIVDKGKLFAEVRKLNELLKKIELNDKTVYNSLLYQGTPLATKVFKKNKTKG